MKHSLQNLMSLLEITGYRSSKGRGKTVRVVWTYSRHLFCPVWGCCWCWPKEPPNTTQDQGQLFKSDCGNLTEASGSVSHHVLEKPETGGNSRLKWLP